MKKLNFLAVLILFLSLITDLDAQLRLPALVRDSMVLQRDTRIKIWGWAGEGQKVRISFLGKNYNTKADKDGKWDVWLPPQMAGGPYNMEISADKKIVLRDILVGDVWFCAGQSNMVHYMGIHSETYGQDIAGANYPFIRQFLVPTETNLDGPADDLGQGYWKAANHENVKRFSVVAYFFALELYEKYGVPIGIINASVGGTPIEAWTSEEGLSRFPDIMQKIERNRDTAYVNSRSRAVSAYQAKRYGRPVTDKGLTGTIKWFDPAYEPVGWKTINIPGYWEDQGIRDLNGAVWYRREIEVPASMVRDTVKIALGRIVDADILYINGKQVGNTSYQYPQRRYFVPPGVLKPGKNILVIQVRNYSGKGGFVPDKPYYLSAGGVSIDLKGEWQYRVGDVYIPDPDYITGISFQNQPTALYNGMVAPATGYAVKGICWYQGESNAGDPEMYRQLLPAFIKDWRTKWKQGELPFLVVQLPNYMEVNYSPENSNWAIMREVQAEVLNLPTTGLAVTIDLGEWNDVHPDNKKPVGERLALAAMKVAYHEKDLVYSGPVYRSSTVEGNRIIVSFDHTGGGLVTDNGEEPAHFAIAGADKKFRWANAHIVENTVVVWNDDIPEPVYVRYAWADNPDFANLYNREGLPATPFRTDR